MLPTDPQSNTVTDTEASITPLPAADHGPTDPKPAPANLFGTAPAANPAPTAPAEVLGWVDHTIEDVDPQGKPRRRHVQSQGMVPADRDLKAVAAARAEKQAREDAEAADRDAKAEIDDKANAEADDRAAKAAEIRAREAKAAAEAKV